MSKDPVRIGLLGLGTVGQALVRLLRDNGVEIERRLGRPLVVTRAAVRDPMKPRSCTLDGIAVTADAFDVVRAADVDVIVELIGGLSPARELLIEALSRGRAVVTANKALLAEAGNEIFAQAQKSGAQLAFEAAVGGGIPIVKSIREGLSGNRIQSVIGIINGTCNYILTQMENRELSFAEALAEAQRRGFAEADPKLDVDGSDAAHKLAILAAIAFGMPTAYERITVEGIAGITPQDLQLARELGYKVKHLGIAKRRAEGVELRVHPTLIGENQLLAKVDGVLNAIVVQGNAVDRTGYYGAGAGGDATASAVLADLVDVARQLGAPGGGVPTLAFQPDALHALPVLPISEIESAYYLRLTVADVPGVLRAISAILAELDISIEAIIQKEPRPGQDATVAILTSVVREQRCDAAVARMKQLPFVHAGIVRLRVEHL